MTPCARFFSVIRNGVVAGPKNGNEFNGQILATYVTFRVFGRHP